MVTKKNIMIFVSLVGLAVSTYLAYLYSQPEPIVCATDCELVRESKYSTLYGIKVPILGIIFYTTSLIALFLKNNKKIGSFINFFLQIMLTTGFIYSIYLTFIEVFVINAICQWCVVSAICSLLLFVIHTSAFLEFLEKRKIV
ncbi:MAG: hypothetical protein KatS3mg085_704 [Candidatus Dojkabacteria bacterium]|nr:MAG: hypothetical protein KatS3mg085_704 [Candidatus Dojkabacteria bacterium]